MTQYYKLCIAIPDSNACIEVTQMYNQVRLTLVMRHAYMRNHKLLLIIIRPDGV